MDTKKIKQLLLSPKGRISRKTYWLFFLFVFTIQFIVAFLGALLKAPMLEFEGMKFNICVVISYFIILSPSIIIQIKRWHDINKSGYYVLLGLIPYIGAFISVIFNGFFPGTVGENQFGKDPREKEEETI